MFFLNNISPFSAAHTFTFFNYVEEKFYCCAVIFVRSGHSCNLKILKMHSRNIFLLLLLVIKISLTSTSEHQHVVCDSVEARSYRDLENLTNCTIVVGNVAVIIGYVGAIEENFTIEEINSRQFPLRYTRVCMTPHHFSSCQATLKI